MRQSCFFSNSGMTSGSMNALWLAAPPITISFLAWARPRAGAVTASRAPTPVAVRKRRRDRELMSSSSCGWVVKSRRLVEPRRVVPQELPLGFRREAQPAEGVVDGVRELAIGGRVE